MAAESRSLEDYPYEIDEQLTTFDSSVNAVKTMLEKLMSMSRNDQLEKLDPLDQAKLDLIWWVFLLCVFMLFSFFLMERIRTYMNRVKEITDKKKAARLDKGAASRFLRNALFDPESKQPKKAASKKPTRSVTFS
uniref:Nuclear nucleic acid-binding protein C1D n=1 Tax=Nothobranchius furzeri TaxID=105023 RepID=A0A8C6W006_NOTFU